MLTSFSLDHPLSHTTGTHTLSLSVTDRLWVKRKLSQQTDRKYYFLYSISSCSISSSKYKALKLQVNLIQKPIPLGRDLRFMGTTVTHVQTCLHCWLRWAAAMRHMSVLGKPPYTWNTPTKSRTTGWHAITRGTFVHWNKRCNEKIQNTQKIQNWDFGRNLSFKIWEATCHNLV